MKSNKATGNQVLALGSAEVQELAKTLGENVTTSQALQLISEWVGSLKDPSEEAKAIIAQVSSEYNVKLTNWMAVFAQRKIATIEKYLRVLDEWEEKYMTVDVLAAEDSATRMENITTLHERIEKDLEFLKWMVAKMPDHFKPLTGGSEVKNELKDMDAFKREKLRKFLTQLVDAHTSSDKDKQS